jgi:hypothetical protein
MTVDPSDLEPDLENEKFNADFHEEDTHETEVDPVDVDADEIEVPDDDVDH